MVGNEEGNGDFRCDSAGLCNWPQCRSFSATRTRIPQCCYSALEGKPCAHDADAKDQAAAEAAAEAGFHDPLGGRALSLAREAYAASGEVFPDRLVHGQPPKRYYWFKMVDGEL